MNSGRKPQNPVIESLRLTEGKSFAMVVQCDLTLLLCPWYAFLLHLQIKRLAFHSEFGGLGNQQSMDQS